MARDSTHRIELVPNCSLSLPEAMVFLVSVAVAPLFIAMILLAQGFWPVLPLAVLELVVLAWALWISLRRGAQRECLLLDDDTVTIERYHLHRRRQVAQFPRYWARVVLHRGATRHAPSRLMLHAHGRRCEIGSFLREEERASLARRLAQLVGSNHQVASGESQNPRL